MIPVNHQRGRPVWIPNNTLTHKQEQEQGEKEEQEQEEQEQGEKEEHEQGEQEQEQQMYDACPMMTREI